MSVGFIRMSPYWQYVTVYLGNPCIQVILRSPPRGFSMNQYVGDRAKIKRKTC